MTDPLNNPTVKHLASLALSTFVAAVRPVHETYLDEPVEGAEAYLYQAVEIPLAEIEQDFQGVVRDCAFPAAFFLARDVYEVDGGQVYRCGVSGKHDGDKLILMVWSTRGRLMKPDGGYLNLVDASVAHFGLFSDWPATKLDLTAGRAAETPRPEIVVHQSVAEA